MYSRFLRIFLSLTIGLLLLLLLLFGLVFLDTALSVWQRVQTLPIWLQATLAVMALIFSAALGLLLHRLLASPQHQAERNRPAPASRALVEARLERAEALGASTSGALNELNEARRRSERGEVHAALFGDISSGKSTLIRALLPDAEAQTGVTGGTTREIRRYTWSNESGDQLILSDMPGLQEVGGQLDQLSSDEALRAHLVIYLCEGDLTRQQFSAIRGLAELGKPLIVAINKSDRFGEQQLEQIRQRIREHLAGFDDIQLINVSAGGRREVILIDAQGEEQRQVRELPPQVDRLREAIQRVVDGDPEVLEQLRDRAIFQLAVNRLDAQIASKRQQRAQELVSGYSKKAVAGALAAITPGTDLLIQGWLASRMVRELCELYEVPVREMEVDRLLDLIKSRTSRATALLLAIVGNALKAFPGAGTLLGGGVHAVAYGIIFDALGRAIVQTLEDRGELRPQLAASYYKESLSGNLEGTAKHFARLALEEIRRPSDRT